MRDVEIIEQLEAIVARRRYVASRKLHNQALEVLKNNYTISDKGLDKKIKKIIDAVNAVTLTCSTRYKVRLDIIEFGLRQVFNGV